MGRPKKQENIAEVSTPSIEETKIEDFEVNLTDNIDPKEVEVISPTDCRWTEYVLGQLEHNERQDDNPKIDGLRRLVEKLVGPIISTEIDCKVVPSSGDSVDNNTATVVAKIVVMNNWLNKPTMTMAVADASPQSCQHPYSKFLTSIAETRAKARCYREILRLQNVVSADEIQGVGQDLPNKITDGQIALIDRLSKELNISVQHIVQTAAGEGNKKPIISKYSKQEAIDIITKITQFMKSGKSKSKDAPDYDIGWREYFA